MEDQVAINAKIGTRTYKMKVDKANEEFVRNSLHGVLQKMNQFKVSFPGRDEQDYLAMTLMDYITTSDHTKNDAGLQEDLKNQLEKISILLER